jgi:putative tryptophan/tyrosine transport system substrate-binding protein
MSSWLVDIRGYWGGFATTFFTWLAYLTLVLTLCSTASIVMAHEKEGFVVLPNQAPRFPGPVGEEEDITEILATREQTGGSFGVWRYTKVREGGPPLHIHRTEDEFFYVLRGEFNFQLGDCITRTPAGSFVFIPKDMVHTFQRIGSEPGVLLGSVHPGGFEGLFQGLPGSDAEMIKALFKKYNMDIVGPPLDVAMSPVRLTTIREIAATAQPATKVYRIGVLAPGCHPPSSTLDILLQGLRDLGYVEGQNLVIEWRYSEGKAERFADLTAELVRQNVDLIVAVSTPAALAAKHATQTIPIVMVYVADPVGTGLVAGLARPEGNVTGVSDMATELSAKRLELLKEAMPTLARVAVLWNAADPGMVLRFREIEAAARGLGVTLQPLEVRGPNDFEPAFTAMTQERPDALFVVAEALTLTHRCRVLDFAAQHRLPAMYEFGVFAHDGGLMAYGPKLTETFQRGAYYIDRILQGTKPANLPVEQPMRFELVINLETAKTLGLTLPPTLLVQADRANRGGENRCARLW